MSNANQLGFSLLESLLALALISVLCLSLMQMQLRLFHHIQYHHYQQLAAYAQLSLAERLRSCLGKTECQQLEIERWQNTLRSISLTSEYRIAPQANTLISTLHGNKTQGNTTLVFSYG